MERAGGDAASFEAGPLGAALVFIEVAAALRPADPGIEQARVGGMECHADRQPAAVVVAWLDVLEQLEGTLRVRF